MTPKKCGYCRRSFTPRDGRHSYCKEACGVAGRREKYKGYQEKKLKSTSAHITRALDRFEATYGTRIPAEVPEGLTAWCELLQEAV